MDIPLDRFFEHGENCLGVSKENGISDPMRCIWNFQLTWIPQNFSGIVFKSCLCALVILMDINCRQGIRVMLCVFFFLLVDSLRKILSSYAVVAWS